MNGVEYKPLPNGEENRDSEKFDFIEPKKEDRQYRAYRVISKTQSLTKMEEIEITMQYLFDCRPNEIVIQRKVDNYWESIILKLS